MVTFSKPNLVSEAQELMQSMSNSGIFKNMFNDGKKRGVGKTVKGGDWTYKRYFKI